MIRDRLLGERPPQLKSKTDRRRILAVWLSRLQATKLATDTKEFVAYVKDLDSKEGKPAVVAAKPAPKAAPAAKPAEKPAEKAEEKKAEEKPADKSAEEAKAADADKPAEDKPEEKKE